MYYYLVKNGIIYLIFKGKKNEQNKRRKKTKKFNVTRNC